MPFVPYKKGKRKMVARTLAEVKYARRGLSMMNKFDAKNAILEGKFKRITPIEFYSMMFRGDLDARQHYYILKDAAKKITYPQKGKKRKKDKKSAGKVGKSKDIQEILDVTCPRSDAYIYPCFFRSADTEDNARTNKKCLHFLYAVTIDIDNVTPEDLAILIKSENFQKILPTTITNSGGGVHLTYMLDEPLRCYYDDQDDIYRIIKSVRNMFRTLVLHEKKATVFYDPNPTRQRNKYKVDNTSLVQPYRVVGSLTKMGQIVTAYQTGFLWKFADLAALVGVKFWQYSEDQKAWHRQYKEDNAKWKNDLAVWRKERSERVESGEINPAKMPKTKQIHGFFLHCDRRMTEVQEHSRNNALWAIVVVAAKCAIDIDYLRERMIAYVEYWNKRDRTKVDLKEIDGALKWYKKEALTVRASTLEEKFGFKFYRRSRYNMTRAEYMQSAIMQDNRRKIAAGKSAKARDKVQAYLAEHPNATTTEIANTLHMSRSTVVKYRNS